MATFIVSADRRQDIAEFIEKLPEILSGRGDDVFGIRPAMHARVGYTLIGLIDTAFQEKGRGRTDEAGESWAPLSEQYLAYGRPTTGRNPPQAGKLAPGGKGNNDGYMSKAELQKWKNIYAHTLKWAVGHFPLAEAKAIAAAKAWNVMKKAGVQTKLGTFGQRKVGVDYQTLVDTGALRRSLQPGTIREYGPDAEYDPKNSDQIFESGTDQVVIGSRDRTAAFHHYGKGRRKRRLWPERFPDDWWRQVVGSVRGGIMQFVLYFGGREA